MLCEGVGRGMMDSLVYCNARNFSSIGWPRTQAIADWEVGTLAAEKEVYMR
jgi:hypothetical protein